SGRSAPQCQRSTGTANRTPYGSGSCRSLGLLGGVLGWLVGSHLASADDSGEDERDEHRDEEESSAPGGLVRADRRHIGGLVKIDGLASVAGAQGSDAVQAGAQCG